MKSAHVSDWERAQSLVHRSERERACERLLSEWLLGERVWRVEVFGHMWQGRLVEVQHLPVVLFAIEVAEGDSRIRVQAPFERFVSVEQGRS